MTDCTSLSCKSTTVNIYQNIKFISCVSCYQRLTNNYFQSFKTEILIDISFIDCDFTGSRYKIYSCY